MKKVLQRGQIKEARRIAALALDAVRVFRKKPLPTTEDLDQLACAMTIGGFDLRGVMLPFQEKKERETKRPRVNEALSECRAPKPEPEPWWMKY